MSTGRPTIDLDQPRVSEVCGFDGNPRLEGRHVCPACAERIDKAAARLKAKAKAKQSSP